MLRAAGSTASAYTNHRVRLAFTEPTSVLRFSCLPAPQVLCVKVGAALVSHLKETWHDMTQEKIDQYTLPDKGQKGLEDAMPGCVDLARVASVLRSCLTYLPSEMWARSCTITCIPLVATLIQASNGLGLRRITQSSVCSDSVERNGEPYCSCCCLQRSY